MTASTPAPPWRTPAKKAPARQPLTQDAIVDAALRVLDSKGLQAVSMRQVAQELDAAAASLYVHVANKEELLELVADRIYGEVEIPAPDPAHWRERLIELAINIRGVLSRHHGIARAIITGAPLGPNGLRITEGMLAIMRAGEVPDQVAGWAVDILSMFVLADVFESSLYAAKGWTGPDDPQAVAYWKQVGDYYRSLPAEEFPHTRALVDTMIEGGDDERFRFGIELFVDGLARRAERG